MKTLIVNCPEGFVFKVSHNLVNVVIDIEKEKGVSVAQTVPDLGDKRSFFIDEGLRVELVSKPRKGKDKLAAHICIIDKTSGRSRKKVMGLANSSYSEVSREAAALYCKIMGWDNVDDLLTRFPSAAAINALGTARAKEQDECWAPVKD